MSEHEVKYQCNALLRGRKNCSFEIDEYRNDNGSIFFKIRLRKNGSFRIQKPITLFSGTHLGNQLDNQVGLYLASVDNNLV